MFTPEVLRKVYAVDKDPKRFKYMKEVVELANGSDVVETIFSDIFEIKMAGYSDVEYVLVDPSCSGTGISERAKIDNHREVSSGRLKNLSGFQKDLLGRVCTYFPRVRRIVYCTCSVREEENEQVVEEIVKKFGAKFEVEDLRQHPALSEWKHFGSDKYENGKKCFYALPSDYCTGFFAAVLVRTDVDSIESVTTHKQGKRNQANAKDVGKKKKQKFK
uniref:Probable 28S rRNA (Cytosine-C(5))-methyltransferase n=1 Tax=Cacopsylla melanoneura TaxID=428564 RepID=A0A8D9BJD6_9HEMI